MRQIKFKAKINHTVHGEKDENFGKWVIGLPQIDVDRTPPWNVRMNPIKGYLFSYPVDPETICECTDGKDKNGKEIYEHDLLDFGGGVIYEALKGQHGNWMLHPYGKERTDLDIHLDSSTNDEMVVVGNSLDDYEPHVLLYGKDGSNFEAAKAAVNETYKDVIYYSWDNEELQKKEDEDEFLDEPER